ncbi:uncharacterized protein PAC_17884 [Phialocephala subalpina]|uniref:F-box domain-containing protein n=1 Tax=Phialocephala subalpina TaxID=576137 RepID=A0A1L7XSJ0_9HELO|nr:uncharacterized protein PAC_17884 [Phialocephala subalpina]
MESQLPQASSSASPTSRLEALPDELLQDILHYCLLPLPKEPYTLKEEQKLDYGKAVETSRKFPSCVLVSKRIYQTGQPLLWRHLRISSGSRLDVVLSMIKKNPELGKLVRTFDARSNPRVFSLLQAKEVVEFMPLLHALTIVLHVSKKHPHDLSSLKRLTHFKCAWYIDHQTTTTAQSLDHELILPVTIESYKQRSMRIVTPEALGKHFAQLPRLQELHIHIGMLGETGNLIGDLPQEAKIRVLTLTKTSTVVVDNFIEPLISHGIETGLTKLLSRLPRSLRCLSLTSTYLTRTHIPALQQLCSRLEELRIGNPRRGFNGTVQTEYDKMIRISDVEDMVLSVKEPRTLKRLDISGLAVSEQLKLGVSSLLTTLSLPLEVVIVLD